MFQLVQLGQFYWLQRQFIYKLRIQPFVFLAWQGK